MPPIERIADRILSVRGMRVLPAADLAALYGVATRVLSQAVRRNAARFPRDFAFVLSKQELADLRSQIVISSWGGRRYAPLVFTEHGALMAATVLSAPRAIEVSLFVVRVFVRMREAVAGHAEIAKRLDELELRVGKHDESIGQILSALRRLTQPVEPARKRRIGFV